MKLNKNLPADLCILICFLANMVFSQDISPWADPTSTGRSQPVYIVDATINGTQIDISNDWIGIFDDSLIVGKDRISSLPASDPIVVFLEYTPPGSDPLPGAREGYPMLFRIWEKSSGQVLDATIAEVISGTAEFSEGGIVAVTLSATKPSHINFDEHADKLSQGFRLYPNYPNPFNPCTTVRFYVGRPSRVKVAVFNVQGSTVSSLMDVYMAKGEYEIMWDGLSDDGKRMGAGMYIIRMQADHYIQTRKVLLVQ